MALELELKTLDGLDENIQSLYAEKDGVFKLDVLGLPDVTGLKTALDAERSTAKTAKKDLNALKTQFDAVDMDKYKNIMDRFENDEDMKLIADGKIEEVFQRKAEKRDLEWQKQLDAKDQLIQTELDRVESYRGRVLDEQLRAGISQAGFHENATDDALSLARTMFVLDDNGNAVHLDGDGDITIGKDGKNFYSVAEWANSDELRKSRPHWRNAVAGGSGMIQSNASVSGLGKGYEGLSLADKLEKARNGKL